MMKKILLYLSHPDFEYDIYHLIRAFYPESEPEIHRREEKENSSQKPIKHFPDEILRFHNPHENARTEAFDQYASGRREVLDRHAPDFRGTLEDPGRESMKYPGTENRRMMKDGTPAEAAFTVNYRERAASFTFEDLVENRSFTRSIYIPDWSQRIDAKNRIKQMTYQALRTAAGRDLPWGDLTGIRPVRLALRLLEEGKSKEEAEKYFREAYFTTADKAALALQVAAFEQKALQAMDPSSGYSLYVHIPYCPSICLYCTFGTREIERDGETVEPYLRALKKELEAISEKMKGRRLDTIYIGGGTPTSLTSAQLEDLLGFLQRHFDTGHLLEYTVEAGRPDSITRDKLEVLQRFGISRISINPQSMNQKTLDIIGRRHTPEDVEDAFHLARTMGFDNINMDLIAGLPSEGEPEVRRTLEKIKALSPDGLTIHSLALKRASRLKLFKDEYAGISFENSEEIMEEGKKAAESMGMVPYYLYRQKSMAGNLENVGYARPEKACLYNILIMEEKQTILAAGAGASSKFLRDGGERIERVVNVKNVTEYIARIDEMIERKLAAVDSMVRSPKKNR